MKHLVIVESPAKAKTIEKYLGKDYSVKSSFGHIRDLPKKGISIDIAGGFEPTYEVPVDKKKVVSELKKAAKEADAVWLASDEDREGEAIAWHLAKALNLNTKTTKRIVFHEITKPAILHAIENPRTIDEKLVDAQQARRILDRLVGYELSPILWKKVKPGLSAGRVQSVAVRLIVDREREIEAFETSGTYKVSAEFLSDKDLVTAELPVKFETKDDAMKFLRDCIEADYKIESIDEKPSERNPSAPFTTSTLQQEAARKLGFSVKQTMTLAQRLYESGSITYMRTDSTNLSEIAIKNAHYYIESSFGANYIKERRYRTKNASAQEAHEAIRPTDFTKLHAGSDETQKKLYRLIWQRTLASQMAPAKTTKTEVSISISSRQEKFIAKGEVLVFDGFYKVYGGAKDDTLLPKLSVGQVVALQSMIAKETFSKPPARYSEASLVRKLEELGIGRPSTYAPTISTIQTRGYVEKGDLEGNTREANILTLSAGKITEDVISENFGADRNKLLPTFLATITTDFLVKHFSDIVDYDFTANAEDQFDKVAEGQIDWRMMLSEFYGKFHPLVKEGENVSRKETTNQRSLGLDPKDSQPIYARFGRFGPMLQKGDTENEDLKPVFAPLPPGSRIEDVTLEQALEMFKLPRRVGVTADGEEIKANIGRFGPYVQVGKLYVSLKEDDPLTVTEAKARQLIADKKDAEAKKLINDFGDIKVLNGMYGPYITDGKKNAKIPKDSDPKLITKEEAIKLLAEAPEKGKGRRFVKKSAPKTTKRVVKRKTTKKK